MCNALSLGWKYNFRWGAKLKIIIIIFFRGYKFDFEWV
jgi:hypothetical protein